MQHRMCGRGRKSIANGKRDNCRVCFGNPGWSVTWEFPGPSQAPLACKFDTENEDFITAMADIQLLPFPACHILSKAEALAHRRPHVGNVPISAWVLSPRTLHSRSSTTCGRACMDLYSQSCQYNLIASQRKSVARNLWPKTTLRCLWC